MKKIIRLSFIVMAFFVVGCNGEADDISGVDASTEKYSGDASNGGQGQHGGESGVVTAGEWNDLEHWSFWNKLMNSKEYSGKQKYWSFYTNNRISVLLKNGDAAVQNAKVELFKGNNLQWVSRTDNVGKAELWVGLFQRSSEIKLSDYSLFVNGQRMTVALKPFDKGLNEIQVSQNSKYNKVELSFIVDATGSMGDELEFLKEDLKDVIQKVAVNDSNLDIYTSSVFYRDEGDDYVVRKSDFSNSLDVTLDFINKQSADGGGDFPEAVHIALETAMQKLSWSENAKTRIAFLMLDAPPHYTKSIVAALQKVMKQAAEKGVKLIPITASGIDKETEFLMRFFSIATNGTYVFITNHSGVGNEHLEASVGEYQVEKLNDLMVRLIKKYTK